ncbi:MAG: hypothetical protein K0U39_09140 [Alphaproteobacteria bacterium]|nr:hypothetical protein [Alphaproteobacteria bacterium]
MKKPLHTPIKIFALLLFIASFGFSAQQANAQETGTYQPETNDEVIDEVIAVKSTKYKEISTSSGHVFYADPELWNNDQYYSIGFRFVVEQEKITGFFDFNATATHSATSPIDGLTRQSQYQKFIFGFSFEENRAATRFFLEYGVGLIKTRHSVQGVAAWRSSESDEIYPHQIIYENAGPFFVNDAGGFVHVEFGMRVQNRHKFSLYIQPIIEGTLTARAGTSYGKNDGDEPGKNYYYGEIPDKIVNGMVGFRYSYILPKSWDRTSFERHPFNPYDKE